MKSPSPLIAKNALFLEQIHGRRRSGRKQRELIVRASDEQLLSLVEICLNVLKGRVPLKKRLIRRLQSQAQLLRRLSRTRTASAARNVLLQQQGSGIPAIAGMLASIVVPMLYEHINRAQK